MFGHSTLDKSCSALLNHDNYPKPRLLHFQRFAHVSILIAGNLMPLERSQTGLWNKPSVDGSRGWGNATLVTTRGQISILHYMRTNWFLNQCRGWVAHSNLSSVCWKVWLFKTHRNFLTLHLNYCHKAKHHFVHPNSKNDLCEKSVLNSLNENNSTILNKTAFWLSELIPVIL